MPGGTSNQRAPTIKKIIFVDRQTFRVKTSIEVVEYDISGVKDHIIYRSDSISGGIFSIQIRPNERPLLDSIAFYGEPNISKTINKKIGGGYEIEYPYYVYVASDETETDEVATRFIYFPPPDTDEQWLEQVEPRITNLARCYVDGIPGQHSRIDGLDNRVGTADEAGQLSIGYLRWQFEKHRDGITGTDNQVYTTKEELEDLIEKMEERFPSKDAVNKFYYRHPSQKWGSSSTRGQIYIAGDDHDFGEKIHDTFHAYVSSGIPRQTRNVGPTDEVRKAQENSDRDLAEIKQAFVRGTISDKDTIITKRTVEPQEYTPPERNSKLSDLRVVRQNGDLLFPSGLSTTYGIQF